MIFIITAIAFLVIFTLIVLVHELGHFSAARKFGVKVEEFGLGLPPKAKRLFQDKKKTEYTLNWLPLGGFVRMKGEDSFDKKALKGKDSFAQKPVWQKMIIICAGVTMNVITGFLLLVIVFMLGSSHLTLSENVEQFISTKPNAEIVSQEDLGMLIQEVEAESPASVGEIRKVDFISAIDGQSFASVEEFQDLLRAKSGSEAILSISRRQHKFEATVTPNSEGKIGIALIGPMTSVKLRYSFFDAIGEAGNETARLGGIIVSSVGNLFGSLFHGSLPKDIGGPIKIVQETFYRASSITSLLTFAAALSITLAIFNILPIPALDGGRLLFLIFEAFLRKKISPSLEAKIHGIGYVLLLGLILIISWQDIFG